MMRLFCFLYQLLLLFWCFCCKGVVETQFIRIVKGAASSPLVCVCMCELLVHRDWV